MQRGVAQSGSVPGLGPGGRRFESCRPDKSQITVKLFGFFYSLNLYSPPHNKNFFRKNTYLSIIKKSLNSRKIKSLCLNDDVVGLSADDILFLKNEVLDLMQKKFPLKSKFEL